LPLLNDKLPRLPVGFTDSECSKAMPATGALACRGNPCTMERVFIHEPIRLIVFIADFEAAMDAVLVKHAGVRGLVANGWVHWHGPAELVSPHRVLHFEC
jgi:uncharacterized protein YbcC (UPF0753/DUF2309 family)